jgi:hypothetical protein
MSKAFTKESDAEGDVREIRALDLLAQRQRSLPETTNFCFVAKPSPRRPREQTKR